MAKPSAPFWDMVWWEFGQNLHVDEAHAEAGRIDLRSRDIASDLRHVRDRLDRLVLLTLAAMSLLKEKAGVTDEEFMARVRQIDLSDGVADGKARKAVRCPQCNAVMSTRHHKCLWCGHRQLNVTFLDEVT